MRVFLTGGTGFIGGQVAKRLRERGDEVVAFVRSRARSTALEGLGCEIFEGNLDRGIDIERGIDGCDSVFHLAGRFEVGVPASERGPMTDANVGGVERLLTAAQAAETPRILHVSTSNVFGNTSGQVVDESYQRDIDAGFASIYDTTKFQAHEEVRRRIAQGMPIVIAQPGLVYGPGDHSEIGRELLLAARGHLGMLMLADIGLSMVHVDDVADGLLRVFDNGEIGESYILGGVNVRLREAFVKVAELTKQRLPMELPTSLVRLVAPIGPFVAPKLGYPPNMHELIRVADRKTYWVSSEKAAKNLGYSFRSLEDGLAQTLEAAGISITK